MVTPCPRISPIGVTLTILVLGICCGSLGSPPALFLAPQDDQSLRDRNNIASSSTWTYDDTTSEFALTENSELIGFMMSGMLVTRPFEKEVWRQRAEEPRKPKARRSLL